MSISSTRQSHLEESDDLLDLPAPHFRKPSLSLPRESTSRPLRRSSRQSGIKRESLAPSTLDDLPEIVGESDLARRTRLSIANLGRQSPMKPSATPATAEQQLYSEIPESEVMRRTRLSISNLDQLTANAQLARTKSLKAMERKKRESYMPKRLEITSEEAESKMVESLEKLKLDEIDYESAFMSRPKVQLSPPSSPIKAWGEAGGVAEAEYDR